jgi:hypothetical protein
MKVRLIRTMVVEFELLPEYYPDGFTPEEMAEFEANIDDRELQFENPKSDEITWELLK